MKIAAVAKDETILWRAGGQVFRPPHTDPAGTLGRLLAALADDPGRVTATVLELTGADPVAAAIAAGLDAGPTGETGWFTAYRSDTAARPGCTVHIWDATAATTPDALMSAGAGVWRPDGQIDALTAVQRVGWWFSSVGTPYHGTPGLSALDAMRARVRDQTTGKWPARLVERPGGTSGAGELLWQSRRIPRQGVDGGHSWDMRAAYLAAAGAAYLGWGEPQPTGADPGDAAPGWYRVELATPPMVAGVVSVIHPGYIDRRTRTAWVTWPVLAFLHEIDVWPPVVDSITSKTGSRILRSWAEQWRDLLSAPLAPRGVLKQGYTQAIGLLGRPGGMISRPDWHDTIRDYAKVSLLRRVHRVHKQTGLAPVAVRTDAVTYPATVTAEQAAAIAAHIGEGDRIGNMRKVNVNA